MNSLADLPDEFHCHRIFIKILEGISDVNIAELQVLNSEKNYEYCPHCKKKSSVKADTKVFSSCNLSFRQIYILVWCWQAQCSTGETMKISGLKYPTIKRWLVRFGASLEPRTDVLEGACEVDGSFFGRRRYGKQKLAAGVVCKAKI